MKIVTFILGLCGAGKTHLADRIVADQKLDEGFLNDQAQHTALIAALNRGEDCVVIEIAYCERETRRSIVDELNAAVRGVTIRWLCIENDLYRANKNCHERTNKGDAKGHVEINRRVSPVYTYPDDAVVLKMWTREC